jgi:hypothetical protein
MPRSRCHAIVDVNDAGIDGHVEGLEFSSAGFRRGFAGLQPKDFLHLPSTAAAFCVSSCHILVACLHTGADGKLQFREDCCSRPDS